MRHARVLARAHLLRLQLQNVNFEILEHFGNFSVVYQEKLFVIT